MSDTKPTAEEASNNPAELVAQTDGSAKDEKAAVDDTSANSATKGAPADGKLEESSDKTGAELKERENGDSDKKRGFGRQDRKNDRNGKYDRGDKRKGSYNDKHRHKKSKTNEFADLPETDDPLEIRAQVEFYFSSANLSQDKHMFIEIKGAENRPVPIKHITSFKRMHRFQPYSAVVAALRDSNDLIVIDDGKFSGAGNEGVQRKEPLTVPTRDDDDKMKPTIEELYTRMFHASQNKLDASVYVKGFGKEEDAGQIALENFFKPYGAIMVRKRRDEDENWKGSVFVEFDSEDSQQQFLALDPKPKFNGSELLILSKKEYSEKKCEEKGIVPAWKREPGAGDNRREYRDRDRNGRGGRGRGRGGHDRRGSDRRHNDRRRDRDRSRSPRRSRRDRSNSRDSQDSGDWNGRRDKFQKSNYGRDKRDRRNRSRDRNAPSKKDNDNGEIYVAKSIIKDADGVPIIQDTSKEPSNKRKANDDGEEAQGSKKSKIEILVDA